MSKYKWAVCHDGYENACGSDYGLGDGNSKPTEVLLGMFEEKADAIDCLKKLRRAAEEAKPEHWIPGSAYLMPTYSIRDYSPDLGWTDLDFRDDDDKHRMNLESCGLKKRRRA